MSAWLPADWQAPPGVRAFTTLRHGAGVSQAPFDSFNLGAHCGDDPAAVAWNRKALVEQAALPSAPRWLRQVHGTTVHRFEDPGSAIARPESRLAAADADADSGALPEADAAVTSIPGVVLAILTADCLPVVLAAADGSEVAAAHAGWRGLAAGVLEQAVRAMYAAPAEVLAWLGPAAGPQAYEVGVEVRQAFVRADPAAAAAFVATRPGHWRVDLYALARQRLLAAGVTRISGGGLCTISDPGRFFSHRRDQRGGRLATLVYLGD